MMPVSIYLPWDELLKPILITVFLTSNRLLQFQVECHSNLRFLSFARRVNVDRKNMLGRTLNRMRINNLKPASDNCLASKKQEMAFSCVDVICPLQDSGEKGSHIQGPDGYRFDATSNKKNETKAMYC